jgi:hypothetical protein
MLLLLAVDRDHKPFVQYLFDRHLRFADQVSLDLLFPGVGRIACVLLRRRGVERLGVEPPGLAAPDRLPGPWAAMSW